MLYSLTIQGGANVSRDFSADRSCFEKDNQHRTREEAHDHRMALLGKRKRRKPPKRLRQERRLTVYRCDVCGFWHVGHEQRKPK